jgi:DASS family divalent anion:Na+ symporter
MAKEELKKLGGMSRQESLMGLGFLLLMSLWILGPLWGVSAELAALLGLCFLLIFQVLSWNQLIKQHNAIETFIWFGALLALAQGLSSTGFTIWFAKEMAHNLQHLSPILGLILLFLVYYYSHYFFASCTAHVGAMFLPFLAGAFALTGPSLPISLAFCYASSLMGGLTHYGNGPAPVLFGSGYVDVKTWWRMGFIMSIVSIVCFLLVGGLWWYILGIL